MKGKSIVKTISIFSLFVATIQLPLAAQNGEATFKQSCGVCHSIGKGKLVGPDLKDVNKRRSEEWILKFVKSSQAFIKSGDADAKAIFDEYGGMIMPDQNLSDDAIKSVIAYVAEQSGGAVSAPVAEAAPSQTETKDTANLADLIFPPPQRVSKPGGKAARVFCYDAARPRSPRSPPAASAPARPTG